MIDMFGRSLVAILLVAGCNSGSNSIPSASTAAAGTLTGVTWHLVSYDDGAGTLIDIVPGSDPTAVFDAAGTISGNGTCNMFSGPVAVNGTTIRLGQLMSTDRACMDARLNGQETAYLKALRSSSMLDVGTGTLEFGNAAGVLTLSFEKR